MFAQKTKEAVESRTQHSDFFKGKRWYSYAHSSLDESGQKRFQAYKKPILNWRSRSHIFTALPTYDGSHLVYGIAFDLDFDKADAKWKSRGKLDWRKIKTFIDEKYPDLGRYLCTWTRSTGGKGLGVILFVDPFIRHHEKTGPVCFLASRVQRLAWEVFNFHGLGCDVKASGIARWTPNWRNGRILLHKDEVTIRRVQRDNEHHCVLRQTYNQLRRSEAFKAETRADLVASGKRFAVKDKANEALAAIYTHVIDCEPESLCISTSYEDLADVSGLSIPTLRKALKSASWATIEKIWGEGFKLTISVSDKLSAVAFENMNPDLSKAPCSIRSTVDDWDLPEPEEVDEDSRNNFIWRKAVILRNEGLTQEEAISTIRGLIKRIPEQKSSRNCRKYESIVISIFINDRRGNRLKRNFFSLEAKAKPLSFCLLIVGGFNFKSRFGNNHKRGENDAVSKKEIISSNTEGTERYAKIRRFCPVGSIPIEGNRYDNTAFAPDLAGDGRVKCKEESVQAVTKVNGGDGKEKCFFLAHRT